MEAETSNVIYGIRCYFHVVSYFYSEAPKNTENIFLLVQGAIGSAWVPKY